VPDPKFQLKPEDGLTKGELLQETSIEYADNPPLSSSNYEPNSPEEPTSIKQSLYKNSFKSST
jgi:hypothetical protein